MTSPFPHPLPVSSPRLAAVAWPGSCCSAADLFSARGFRAIFLARYGDQSAREKGEKRRYAKRGAPVAFLLAALEAETDACIAWPFAVSRGGYGSLLWEGRITIATRVVCAKIHGPPPFDHAEAAHSCRNPSCINHRHLRWASPLENSDDKFAHGTMCRGTDIAKSKLTEDDVRQIRSLKGLMRHRDIAALFNINRSSVSLILSGKTWGWLT